MCVALENVQCCRTENPHGNNNQNLIPLHDEYSLKFLNIAMGEKSECSLLSLDNERKNG